MLKDLLFRLRAIFQRKSIESDLDDELRSHLEHQIDRNLERGLSRDEAVRRAHVDLGGVEQYKEECREAWGIRVWETTRQDVRYAVRQLRHRPAFTFAVVATLALGIGATTALFTVANSLLLRSLPVPNPQDLVIIARNPAHPSPVHNFDDYVLLNEQSRDVFTGVAASNEGNAVGFSLVGQSRADVPEVVNAAFVSPNYFEVLGVGLSIGRVSLGSDGVIVSYDFWQRRLAGNLGVLGQTVRLNKAVFSVAGVARQGFAGTRAGSVPDVYVPLNSYPSVLPLMRNHWKSPRREWLVLNARLKPGVTIAQATARVGRSLLLPGLQGIATPFSAPLLVLLAASGLLLLLACANVAGLLLARGIQREREIAVRLALGASRMRLIRQMLTESVLLAVIGGVIGLFVGLSGARALIQLLPSNGPLPFAVDVSADWRVLAFALAVSVLTGVLFGLGPALRSSRRDVAPSLKPTRHLDLRRVLVVVQVALSVVLLMSVGLMVRSLASLDAVDLGYSRGGLLFVYVQPAEFGYQGPRARQFYERLRERAAQLPGVMMTSLADYAPLDNGNDSHTVAAPARDGAVAAETNTVTADYLKTLGIPVLAGRALNALDEVPGAPPAGLISEALARALFPGENPIGRRVSYGDRFDAKESWQVVGVVRDARYFGLRGDPTPMVYMPADAAMSRMVLCIRTAGAPELLIPAVRREVAELDAAVPVLEAKTMDERVNDQNGTERLLVTVFGSFGLFALVLAAIGLHGVLAFGVESRTREIGIRTALGAGRWDAVGRVVADVGLLFGVGAAVGTIAALAGTRLLTSFLFGVKPFDALAFLAALGILAVAAAVAGYLPARRASKVDPIVALRHD
ncbi:MAG TPA: ABC transporter permease [Bryobacteraceae bacterium]|jgi:predicted permease